MSIDVGPGLTGPGRIDFDEGMIDLNLRPAVEQMTVGTVEFSGDGCRDKGEAFHQMKDGMTPRLLHDPMYGLMATHPAGGEWTITPGEPHIARKTIAFDKEGEALGTITLELKELPPEEDAR